MDEEDAGREWMGTGGWSGKRTAGKALTGHKSSFPWLPEQHGMLHSYNSCHPCMTSCVYLGHPSSYHSLTSFSSCIPPCPSAPIPPSPSFSILLSQVIGSLQHFSILLLSFIAGAWLEGTCNLAMIMTIRPGRNSGDAN